MKKETRLAFNALALAIGTSYGVDDVSKDFTVTPSLHQTLHAKLADSLDFMKKINVTMVDEIKGEKIIGSVAANPGSRIDTSGAGVRAPANLLTLGNQNYELSQTNFDIFMRYATMDSWAKFPDFQERYSSWAMEARALGVIMVGWYGESAAATTNAGTNPLGQDVNIGWYKLLRNFNAGAQVVSAGGTAGQVRIGPSGDYVNIDTAAYDLKMMIPAKYRKDLVVIVGEDLIADERTKMYAALGATPTEKEKLELMAVLNTFGGMPAVFDIPHFPPRGLFVTSLKNLSYYQQEGSMRRRIIDNPSKDRVDDFNSVNDGYVIENEEAAAALEFKNVKLWTGSAWA